MKIILAVDMNNAIGYKNKLLFHIKRDLNNFKHITENNIVIMGRKTYESMGSGLKNRINVVLTRNKNYKLNDAYVFNDKKSLLDFVNSKDKEAFVIGGSEIVDLLIDHCNEAYITKVYERKNADTFLFDFNNSKDWEIYEKSGIIEEDDYKFQFIKYRRCQ